MRQDFLDIEVRHLEYEGQRRGNREHLVSTRVRFLGRLRGLRRYKGRVDRPYARHGARSRSC
jgi:hypothetical protein